MPLLFFLGQSVRYSLAVPFSLPSPSLSASPRLSPLREVRKVARLSLSTCLRKNDAIEETTKYSEFAQKVLSLVVDVVDLPSGHVDILRRWAIGVAENTLHLASCT